MQLRFRRRWRCRRRRRWRRRGRVVLRLRRRGRGRRGRNRCGWGLWRRGWYGVLLSQLVGGSEPFICVSQRSTQYRSDGQGRGDIHKRLPNILPRNHTLPLIGELLMTLRKQMEDLLDLSLLFGGDVVFFGKFGLSRFRGFLLGCCGGGWASALFGGLSRHIWSVSLVLIAWL